MKRSHRIWVEDTLNSLEHIQPVEASPYLYQQVLTRMKTAAAVAQPLVYLPMRLAWRIAVFLALMTAANSLAWKFLHVDKERDTTMVTAPYLYSTESGGY
jgi:hypothetical protein